MAGLTSAAATMNLRQDLNIIQQAAVLTALRDYAVASPVPSLLLESFIMGTFTRDLNIMAD